MNAASNQQTTALPTLPTTIVNRIIGMAKEIEEHEQEKRMEGYLDLFAEWCREQVNSSLVHFSEQALFQWSNRYHALLHRAVAESTTLTEEEQQQAMELMVDKREVLVSLLENEQQTWVQQELAEEPDFEDDEDEVLEHIEAAVQVKLNEVPAWI